MDLFSDIRGLFGDANSLFDGIGTAVSGAKSFIQGQKSSIKEDSGLLSSAVKAGVKSYLSPTKTDQTNALSKLEMGLVSTTKPRGTAGETKPATSVDANELNREWADRMKTFLTIDRDTGVKIG